MCACVSLSFPQQLIHGVREGLLTPEDALQVTERRRRQREEQERKRKAVAEVAASAAVADAASRALVQALTSVDVDGLVAGVVSGSEEAKAALEKHEDDVRVLRWRVLRAQMAARAAESEALQLEMQALSASGAIKIPQMVAEEEKKGCGRMRELQESA